MTPEELDRILGSDEALDASPRFAGNVMTRVRREAEAPAPLRFPWWRFAAGLVGSGGMAVGGAVLLSPLEVLASPPPATVLAIVYAFAMLVVSLGAAAVPRVLSKP